MAEEHQEETKPKAPKGLKEAIEANPPAPYDQTPTPPSGIQRVIVEESPPRPGCASLAMMMAALGLAGCMCLAIITLSGVAGIRDELRTVKTQAARTQSAEIATQYYMGNNDLADGDYEMASIRFEAVVTLVPNYQDAATKLAAIQGVLSATPTPSLTPTLPPPTQTPAPTLEGGTPSATPQRDAAELFARAESAITAQNYEDAIEWLDVLVLVDANYRRQEVQQMRVNALVAQGTIYLRGQNEDGEDRLAQGVQMIFRADELGDVPVEVAYEADFVARYLAARAYVQGGALEQARQVLTRLCEENCDWSYQGISVRLLLSQAGG